MHLESLTSDMSKLTVSDNSGEPVNKMPEHRRKQSTKSAVAAAETATQRHIKDIEERISTSRASNEQHFQTPRQPRPVTRFPSQRRYMQTEKQQESFRFGRWLTSMIPGSSPSSKSSEQDELEHAQTRIAELESEKDELQMQLGQHRGIINGQESKVQKLEKELLQLEEHIEDQESEHRKACKAEHDNHMTLLQEQSEKHAAKEKLIKQKCAEKISEERQRAEEEASRQVKVAKQATQAAQNQQLETEKKCRGYEQMIDRLEKSVRGLQAGALQSVEAAEWAPLDASDIEHKLKTILTAVRQWSQKHALLTFDHVMHPEHFENVVGKLLRDGCVVFPEGLREALLKNKAMQKGSKAMALLYTAMASTFILRRIIGEPFFAFAGRYDDTDILWEGHGASLRNILGLVRQNDERGAEAWRCQLLRMIDPVIADKSRKMAAGLLSNEFFNIRHPQHGNTQLEAMRNELCDIMKQAADISWALWTRKARIEVLTLGELPTQVYDSNFEMFEPHSVHGKDLDDNPEALNGHEIMLLCNPLVIAAGNADGEDYQKRRMLKKAIVWMG